MGLTSRGRLIQGVVVLMLVSALPEVAGEQSPPVQLNEYERTLDALKRYRVLADEDDGAICLKPSNLWRRVTATRASSV